MIMKKFGNASKRKGIIVLSAFISLMVLAAIQFMSETYPVRSRKTFSQAEYVKKLERKVAAMESECEKIPLVHSAAFPRCTPKQKVAFAKTHKTGSSTLQNIFLRYGTLNELNFALPPASWMFTLKEPFKARMVTTKGVKGLLDFDMFVSHSIWNYDEVKRLIPSVTAVTILRDPVDAFESNYVYMGLEKLYKMNINEFALKHASTGMARRKGSIIDKNQLLFDLGTPIDQLENATLVARQIASLEQQFDLVLIVEHFDESLVLLKDILCWNLEDVTYLKQNSRVPSERSNMTAETRNILKDWMWADYVLYDHFKLLLQKKIQAFGSQRMEAEKEKLLQLNRDLSSKCVKEVANNSKLKGEFKMASDIVLGYVIDESKPWCGLYARSEPSFVKDIRAVQLLRASTLKLQGKI